MSLIYNILKTLPTGIPFVIYVMCLIAFKWKLAQRRYKYSNTCFLQKLRERKGNKAQFEQM